jgi:hypothetical protein
MTDALLRLLHGLPQATLDPSEANRIRARCHAALAPLGRRSAGREGGRRRRGSAPMRPARIWTSLVVGTGGLYITAVFHEVLAVYGLL